MNIKPQLSRPPILIILITSAITLTTIINHTTQTQFLYILPIGTTLSILTFIAVSKLL